jgi:2'-5' RNA ligase
MLNLEIDWTKVFRPQGCIIAIPIPESIAHSLAMAGGEPPSDLHVTVVYLEDGFDFDIVSAVVTSLASSFEAFKLGNNGLGRFGFEYHDVLYYDVSCPEIFELHDKVKYYLSLAGVQVSEKYPTYRPHCTLMYIDKNVPTPTASDELLELPIFADSIQIWNNGVRFNYPLARGEI